MSKLFVAEHKRRYLSMQWKSGGPVLFWTPFNFNGHLLCHFGWTSRLCPFI